MRVLVTILVGSLLVVPTQAQYSGGSGTPDDPYQIATAADLIALGETPDDYDKHFILTADIDLDPNLPGRRVFDQAVIAPDTALRYSFGGTSFRGVFNGNGHTISRLTIRGGGYLGLFGRTESGARISNLGLEAIDLDGTDDYVGGVVGHNVDGSITRSYSTGSVSGHHDYFGGLVGYNTRGSITTSYSSGTVSGYRYVGGLVGGNWGTISAC